MRLRRKRPASSVEPDRFEAAAEVLERWATRGSRQSTLYAYKRDAARRQRAPVGAQRYPPTEPLESRSAETPVSTPRVRGDGAIEVGGERVERTTPTPTPRGRIEPAPVSGDPAALANNESPPPPELPPDDLFDESASGVLRRRYGSEVEGSTWWHA